MAAAHGATAKVVIERGPPPIVNPERESGWARTAAERVLGAGNVVPFGITNMGGEDFACYLERIGGCFLRIGAREPGGEPAPAHSPGFVAAEESIFVGAAVLAECARVARARTLTREFVTREPRQIAKRRGYLGGPGVFALEVLYCTEP